MKKFFVTVLLALTVLVSAAAQEENKTLIKINVIDSDLTPKIYVSKLPNFMGHKVLCEGSGEGYAGTMKKVVQQTGNWSADEAKKMLPLGIGLAGTGVAGVTAGLIISGKNKPKLIRVN